MEPVVASPSENAVACPACGNTRTRFHSVYNSHSLRACASCSFVFTEERHFPTEQYEDIYAGETAFRMMVDDARDTHAGRKSFRHLWWFKRKALRWVLREKKHARLLDMGSGPGTFLLVARREFGFDVQGIEPAALAADAANGFGVPTYRGLAESFAESAPQPFDVVTSFEVLEHVPEPLSFLRSARRLIKNDGMLVVSVPNLDDPYCLRQRIGPAMPPIHINFFSRRSMKALLLRAGFSLERTFTLPIPTSSVRNVHGHRGFALRLPLLCTRALLGASDGTTLLLSAVPIVSRS